MVSRIEAILSEKDLTQTQFAASINIQRSTLSHILSGRNKPSLDFVLKVVEAFPEINIEWLTLGIGDMYKAGFELEKNNSQKQQNTSYSLFDDLEDESINNLYVQDNKSPKAKSDSNRVNSSDIQKTHNNVSSNVVKPKSSVTGNVSNTPAYVDNVDVSSASSNDSDASKDSQMKSGNSDNVSNVEIPIVGNVNKNIRAESVVILYNDGTYQVLK